MTFDGHWRAAGNLLAGSPGAAIAQRDQPGPLRAGTIIIELDASSLVNQLAVSNLFALRVYQKGNDFPAEPSSRTVPPNVPRGYPHDMATANTQFRRLPASVIHTAAFSTARGAGQAPSQRFDPRP